jgi:hypothetical protein
MADKTSEKTLANDWFEMLVLDVLRQWTISNNECDHTNVVSAGPMCTE